MTNKRPEAHEAPPYFQTYIGKVPSDNFIATLEQATAESLQFYEQLAADKWDYRYAEGKWNIKEVLMHIMDTERIMAYRALRVSRNDATPLPGFDQDDYVPNYELENRSTASLLEEYKATREATLAQFRPMSDTMLGRVGTASGHPMTPRALAFIITGHEIHHMQILRDRYL